MDPAWLGAALERHDGRTEVMMNVFLTGGGGYIGSHLLALLLEQGDEVHALCRTPLQVPAGRKGLVIHQGEILDRAALHKGMRGCSQVYHLAGYARNWARDAAVFTDVNVRGTRNVLGVAAECNASRVVLTSSVLALGFANGLPLTEEQATAASLPTAYAESKRAAENAALALAQDGPEVVIVNPTRVYGPGRMTEGNSVTRMIKLHLAGRFPLILGDGTAVGNYAHVRDVARGHLCAMRKGRPGQRYILGGENVSFNGLFELIHRLSGVRRSLVRLPGRAAMGLARFEEFRARHLGGYPLITPGWITTFLQNGACSCEKAQRELGYTITPLVAGLEETLAWLRTGEKEQS